MTLHPIGSEVHIDPEYADQWPSAAMVPHATFIVEQLPIGRRKSYVLRHQAGGLRIKARPETVVAGPSPSFAGVEAVPLPTVYENGTVVEHAQFPGLWVITGWSAKGHTMWPLGGGPRGRRNVAGSRLTVVTLDLGEDDKNDSENWGREPVAGMAPYRA
jgi:hypothetical protein